MKTRLACAFVLAAPAALAADDHVAKIEAFVADTLRAEVSADAILAAAAAQNAANAGIDQARIDALDAQWRSEIDQGAGALVDSTLAAPISIALRDIAAKHGGLVTELFVMDVAGLIVGESDRTSDYWQADEPKFQQSFGVGPDAVFVDAVEFDESTQTMQAQVSFTLVDPASGAPVGAATAGINVDMLE